MCLMKPKKIIFKGVLEIMSEFTHLHLHTEYSLLDGMARIDKVLAQTKRLGMDSLAITDHGNMYGVMAFYKQALAAGIHPVIGCEVYVASRDRFSKEYEQDAHSYHLVLLCENEVGYQNLIQMVSQSFIEGFYYKPRVDKDLLQKHHEGLIALSACLNGEVAQKVLQDNLEGARRSLEEYITIFGKDNFFIEIQDHHIKEEDYVRPRLIHLAKEYNIGLVATNDVHYCEKKDANLQDVLLCVQTNKTVYDTDRMKMSTDEFYLKSPQEMESLFANVPEAIENTKRIAKRCQVEFEFGKLHLPNFDVPDGQDHFAYLQEKCLLGFRKHYGDNEALLKRLTYELSIIQEMGYVDYFLIVWDFISYAKSHGIMVGPGRGSAAGSMVAYCLDITMIDPIKYGLIFERFLNPERVTMPDIDVDFCYARRNEVIQYVIDKYGKNNVSQIITFGTMKAKLAIRDVGRALDIPYHKVDAVAKLIPFAPKITIKDALEWSPQLKTLYQNDDTVRQLLDVSMELEGLPRHASTHAAGVVITKEPVSHYVPLQTNDESITTQYTMTVLEELGLLKMDFLGLRNLTVLQMTMETILKTRGISLKLDEIDYNDKRVYDMICRGDNECIFQLEGTGSKKHFLKEIKPRNIEDIIAAISLYRPGPMKKIPDYIKNREHPENIIYPHPALKPILDVTYGCMIYQEQVMQICCDVGGYSVGRSDLVRRAMSKKKKDVMEKERHNFMYGIEENGKVIVDGAIRRGMSVETASLLFDEMMDFAGYAFNKSHAAAYAIVAYQTAYFKALYPTEYMAAMLTVFIENKDTVTAYIEECKRLGIAVLPPDVNKSGKNFSVEKTSIRFSLLAVKNVGASFIERMVTQRELNGPFKDFSDFCSRMAGIDLNKRALESLIKCGAFDNFTQNRATLIASYERLLNSANEEKRNNIAGQVTLFSEQPSIRENQAFPVVDDYTFREKLFMEKEVCGIYISGHPLDEYHDLLDGTGFLSIGTLCHITRENEDGLFYQVDSHFHDGQEVSICGIVMNKNEKTTKTGKKMAFFTLEDSGGEIEIVVFPEQYALAQSFQKDDILVIKAALSIHEDEKVKLIAQDIMPLVSEDTKNKTLYIKLKNNQADVNYVQGVLKRNCGVTPVCLYFEDTKQKLMANKSMWVTPRFSMLEDLKKKLGTFNVKLV